MNKTKRGVKKKKKPAIRREASRPVKKKSSHKADNKARVSNDELKKRLLRTLVSPTATERVLIGVFILSLSLILFSISFLKKPAKASASTPVQKKETVAQTPASTPAPEEEDELTVYEIEEDDGAWQPERFYIYEKVLQIVKIDTSPKSDWYCIVTDAEGTEYAVYQPYGISFAAASEGYVATSNHTLSPGAKASWLYNIKQEGLEDHAYRVRIQNFPMLNRNDKIMPNGTDEIPAEGEMEYITEVIDMIDLESGESTPYERKYR